MTLKPDFHGCPPIPWVLATRESLPHRADSGQDPFWAAKPSWAWRTHGLPCPDTQGHHLGTTLHPNGTSEAGLESTRPKARDTDDHPCNCLAPGRSNLPPLGTEQGQQDVYSGSQGSAPPQGTHSSSAPSLPSSRGTHSASGFWAARRDHSILGIHREIISPCPML